MGKPPKFPKRKKPSRGATFQRPHFTEKDLEGLEPLLKSKWKFAPREHQIQGVRAQLLRRDIIIQAGTGSGKTAIAAGPHALDKAKGCITIMVSPLIALQEEQVSYLHSRCLVLCSPSNEGCNLQKRIQFEGLGHK